MATLTPQRELELCLEKADTMAPEVLARLLSGDLPALGSDYLPAQHIWHALRGDSGRRDQVRSLAHLCADLLGPVGPNADHDYIENLLLLGQMLQEPSELFGPALALERRVAAGEVPLGHDLRRHLRRLIIFNQVDESLGGRWLSMLRDSRGATSFDDVLDAFLGVLWLSSEDDLGIPVRRIREALALLGEALGSRPGGEECLRAALRCLRHSHPNDRWAEWLAPDFGTWELLLQVVSLEEVPGLRVRVAPVATEAKGQVDASGTVRQALADALGEEPSPDLCSWFEQRGIMQSFRHRVAVQQLGSLDTDLLDLQPLMRGAPLPRGVNPNEFPLRWIRAIQNRSGYQRPRSSGDFALEAEDDRKADDEALPTRHLGAYAAYQSALQQIEAITEQLRLADDRMARRWADELVANQRRVGTADSIIAKSLSNLATRARYLGRLALAYDWASQAADLAPADPVARNGLAEVLRVQGKFWDAEALYRQTTTDSPGDAAARNGLAETLRQIGRLPEAEALYRQTVTDFPGNAFARNGLADTLKQTGRLQEAEETYRKAAQDFPGNAVPRNGLSDVLKAQGRFSEAEALYRQAIVDFPDDACARNGLADTLKQTGRLPEAEGLYSQTIVDFPGDAFARTGLADTLKRTGRLQEAEETYREVIQDFPGNSVPRNGLVEVLKAQGRFGEAEDLYRQTIADFPGDAFARTGLADTLKQMDRLPEAEDIYRQTIADFPGNAFAQHGLAGVLVSMGRIPEALVLLPAVERPQSVDDWVCQHLRAMAALRQDNREQGLSLLRSGLSSCPFPWQRSYYCSALAFDALRHGELDNAEELLREHSLFPEQERILDIARLHLAAARNATSACPGLVLLVQDPATAQPIRGVLRLIDARFGVTQPATSSEDDSDLDREIFEAELNLPQPLLIAA